MLKHRFVLPAVAILIAGCSGNNDPTPPDADGTEPTRESSETASPSTIAPEAAPEEPSEPAPTTETQPDFDTRAQLDDLWDDGEEQVGLCTIWRNGEMDQQFEDSELPWDLDEVDEFFSEKCSEIADGSRARPFAQDTDLVADAWSLNINEVDIDALDPIMAENQFNDPPREDYQFVLINLGVQYDGEDEPVDPWRTFDFAIVGADGNTFTDDCGVIPEPLRDVGDMYSGATASGNVCLSVEADQISEATIRIEARSGGDGVFVQLNPAN